MIKYLCISLCVITFTSCMDIMDNKHKLSSKAEKLSSELIILDSHMDVPYVMEKDSQDISEKTTYNFDYRKAVEGHLNVAFFAVYVPSVYEERGGGRDYAASMMDNALNIITRSGDKFELIMTSSAIRKRDDGVVQIAFGLENGTPLEGKMANLHYFYEKGIRYITLCHSGHNEICDSSFGKGSRWGGLSPFGKKLVREMNKLGMIIDVSHVSDSSFYDVMELSEAPVIASHSACRHFTPGWERNMSDDMIRLLAKKGGVIQINFGSAFVREDINHLSVKGWEKVDSLLHEQDLVWGDVEAGHLVEKYWNENPLPFASVKDVADHIEHVVKLVGTDHVGIGSDFDGLGNTLPNGLKDVSDYPNLLEELLRRGLGEDELRKIFSDNFSRVWQQVEQKASTKI